MYLRTLILKTYKNNMKSKNLILFTSIVFLSLTACEGQKSGEAKSTTMITQSDSVSYALGVSIGNNLKKSGFDTINVDLLAKAMKEVYNGDSTKIKAENADGIIQAYMQGAQAKKGAANIEKGRKFLEENSKKPGVVTLPSGLQYQIITAGTGAKPTLTDKVTTHYHGTLMDGTVFDSSVDRGQPASFPVNGVIPGWTEALQLMGVGSKWKLFVPSNLGYGERSPGGKIGANETLIFEVELISIDKADPTAPTTK